MRAEFIVLDIPTVGGATGRFDVVERFLNKTIQVQGTWTGEYEVQAQLKGASGFSALIPSISSNGIHKMDETVYAIRVKCVSNTGGNPDITFGGQDSRSF